MCLHSARMAHTEVLQPGMNWSGLDSLTNFTEVRTSPAAHQQERNTWSCLATSSSVAQGTTQPFHFPFELLPEPSAKSVVCSGGSCFGFKICQDQMSFYKTQCWFKNSVYLLLRQDIHLVQSLMSWQSRQESNLDKMIQGRALVVVNTSKLLSKKGSFLGNLASICIWNPVVGAGDFPACWDQGGLSSSNRDTVSTGQQVPLFWAKQADEIHTGIQSGLKEWATWSISSKLSFLWLLDTKGWWDDPCMCYHGDFGFQGFYSILFAQQCQSSKKQWLYLFFMCQKLLLYMPHEEYQIL